MIQEAFAALANILANMKAIGWAPWPAVICVIVMVIVRKYAEDDILDVTTLEAKTKLEKMKLYSIGIGYGISLLGFYGFDMPTHTNEHIQALVFSALNTALGYMAWSMYKAIDPVTRIKNKYFPTESKANI